MHNIIFLASYHKQQGKCNAEELYRILEKVKPQVIFGQISEREYHNLYKNKLSPQSLESSAIKLYQKEHKIIHLPVDTYSFQYSNIFKQHTLIAQANPQYSKLWIQHRSFTNCWGYEYLNCDELKQFMKTMQALEKRSVLKLNNPSLLKEYRTSCRINNKRHNKMISNIYKWSAQNNYHTALFICDVQHREGIFDKLSKWEKTEPIKLNWYCINLDSDEKST